MGIKNLTKFLRTRYPQLFKIVKLSNFKNMKIAIDISIYICRFKISHGKRWLDAFIKMIICLRKNNINCLFVYDGGFPVEKNIEHAKRKISRQRNIERINILENDLKEYINSGIVTNNLEKVMYFYNQNLNTRVASQTLLRRPAVHIRPPESPRSDGGFLGEAAFDRGAASSFGGERGDTDRFSGVDCVSRGSSEDDLGEAASVEGDLEFGEAGRRAVEAASTKGGDVVDAAPFGGETESKVSWDESDVQRPLFYNIGALGDCIKINIEVIQNKIEKMKRYIFSITQVDYDMTKNMFDIFSIPWIIAPMEAETLCSDLCIQKKIDAVLTEDSDVFAYGNPMTILNINIFDDTCTYINYDELLNTIDMMDGSFLDFCILCGSDYNSNIPKIGIEKSFNFIKKYKTLENIKDSINIDISFLKFKEVRSIFRNYTKSPIDIPFCSIPNYDKLKTFIETNEISTNVEYIKFFLRNK